MGIDLSKLDDVKIEVGPWGGRTLVYNETRFKMNALVKQLSAEEQPIPTAALKKIEKLNHALPENLSLLQRLLTALRQFFGNLTYNRDQALFSLALHRPSPDSYPKSRSQSLPEPVAPVSQLIPTGEPDSPLKTHKPPSSVLHLDPLKPEEFKKVEFKEEPKKEPAPKPSRPPLSRSRSFKTGDIVKTLKEKCTIDDMALNGFAKFVQDKLSVTDSDYPIKLNALIQEISGEPIFRYINDVRTEIAFKNPDCLKIIQYAVIRLITTDFLNYTTKSRFVENLASYFPPETLKAVMEGYYHYLDEKKYLSDRKDDTFRHLIIRYDVLRKQDANNTLLFDKKWIGGGLAAMYLRDTLRPDWLTQYVQRYKDDAEVMGKAERITEGRIRSVLN